MRLQRSVMSLWIEFEQKRLDELVQLYLAGGCKRRVRKRLRAAYRDVRTLHDISREAGRFLGELRGAHEKRAEQQLQHGEADLAGPPVLHLDLQFKLKDFDGLSVRPWALLAQGPRP